jgi:hypothetical protein
VCEREREREFIRVFVCVDVLVLNSVAGAKLRNGASHANSFVMGPVVINNNVTGG